jgi:hypothetical protein
MRKNAVCEVDTKLINAWHQQETRFHPQRRAKAKIRMVPHFVQRQRDQSALLELTDINA